MAAVSPAEGTAMIDLAMEKRHLAQADRDIAEGESRVAQQAELVEKMQRGTLGTASAERLLQTLEQTLQTWRTHRENILAAIAQIESGELASISKPL